MNDLYDCLICVPCSLESQWLHIWAVKYSLIEKEAPLTVLVTENGGQDYSVRFDALLSADWKAAFCIFSLQSARYYPCIQCEAVAHKQVANKLYSICNRCVLAQPARHT
jgi:hypothetical protein